MAASPAAGRSCAPTRSTASPLIDGFLATRGTTGGELILGILAELDAEAQLRRGGLADTDVAVLRRRLLETP